MNSLFKYFKFELLKLQMRKMPCNIETKIDEQHWKRAKKVDMHFYQRVIIHYTHTFFAAASLPVWPLPYPTPPPPALLFYALNHQHKRCRTELKHRMCCIYRIRHDPAPLPRSVSIPDPHTTLFPLSLPLPLAIPFLFPSAVALILLSVCT